MRRELVKHVTGALDVRSFGLAFALLAVVVAVMVFGVAPLAIGLGLATLLLLD